MLNAPSWIEVIWLLCTELQNIKYVLNTMTIWDPISIKIVGRRNLCNKNQHTEGQRSKRERERERTNGKQWSSLETMAYTTGTPLKLELDTKAQDGKSDSVPQVAFIMLLTPTTGHMSHMVTNHQQRKMKWPVISTNKTCKCSFVAKTWKRIT